MELELLPDGRSARLSAPFTVNVDGKIITVPAGFQTDFASVPRLFWNILPPWGDYSPAAVVHDYLYQTGLTSRKEADAIFRKIMGRYHVANWKRLTMWTAVRLCGWLAYKK